VAGMGCCLWIYGLVPKVWNSSDTPNYFIVFPHNFTGFPTINDAFSPRLAVPQML
jgi:hypothetical protein